MNFLAHSHLSFDNDDILFGNFIADSVKGKAFEKFSKDIKKGILLHREIDHFTDTHPTFKKSVSRIRQEFGKYSGIVIDIYYDHFLARNWPHYSNSELSSFTTRIYKILAKRYFILPNRNKRILPFMIGQNWLSGYANLYDLKRVFYGMDRRTGFKSGMNRGVEVLKVNYEKLNKDFTTFYPELIDFVQGSDYNPVQH